MRKKKNSKNEMQLWGVITVILALFFALSPILIFDIAAKQRNTLGWPSVEGEIIVCEIDHRYNKYADRVDERDEYRIDLIYQYVVNTTVYDNFNVYFMGGTGSYWNHELNSYDWSLLANYPVGSNVTVYYDPENPEDSCLIPGEDPDNKMLIILFPAVGYFLLALFPLFIFLERFTKRRKSKRKNFEGKSFMTPGLAEKIKEIKKATES